MPLTCEVCGNKIQGPLNRTEIDGAFLTVCSSCAKRGKPVGPPPNLKPASRPFIRPKAPAAPELEVDPDAPSVVKQARERMGLTHEQLGRLANVKPSVISHIETGKMKPDIQLARTLMHHLRVNLLVPSAELESDAYRS